MRDVKLSEAGTDLVDPALDTEGVECLRAAEDIDSTMETQRRLRLMDLRMVRSGFARTVEAPVGSYRQAMDSFIWGLPPGQAITIVLGVDAHGAFTMDARLSAKDIACHDALRTTDQLQDSFRAALAAAALPHRFAECAKRDEGTWDSVWHAEVVPPGLVLGNAGATGVLQRLGPRLIAGENSAESDNVIAIAQPRLTQFSSLDALLRSLPAAKCAARLAIGFRIHVFTADEIRLLKWLRDKSSGLSWFSRTDGMGPVAALEVSEAVDLLLRSFERDGKAVQISVCLEAATALPGAIIDFAAGMAWGARGPSRETKILGRDWRRLLPLGYQMPQWLPSTVALKALGTPVVFSTSRSQSPGGILLGHDIDGDAVRLSENARDRHILACGATGSGKSTLIANMVLQDVEASRGLILIDPHGDITKDVLARVPRNVANRVVALDLADPDHAPGLNVLDVQRVDAEMAKPLICGELLRIFKHELYPDVPEGFGPMFEAYYRNALMLLLEAEGAKSATLVDVPRVFQDAAYRKLLIDCCANRHVRDFWNKTVDRVTHDEIELPNVTPYVTSKFEPLLGSRAIRTILGQAVTTLDFGAFMDDGRIVLISLAKGMLGTNEARVLGLLLLQQIQIACMSRARGPRPARRPVTLYVDEAQSFVGGALTEMLSEARKFGLRLVLATQTMAQLSGRTSRMLTDVVLGNVANLIALRVGVRDAELFEPWFRPCISADEIVGLPDFACIARILESGRPSAPIMINLPPLPAEEDPAIARTIAASSNASYCRLRDDVEASLDAR